MNGPYSIFFDGDCPLCRREADFLDRLDRGRGRLVLEDFTVSGFDYAFVGRTHEELMREIHGRDEDGSIDRGMEVFRRAYASVGLGWVLAPTGWPVLRPACDAFYRWFARNRMRLTFRKCPEGTCGIHPSK